MLAGNDWWSRQHTAWFLGSQVAVAKLAVKKNLILNLYMDHIWWGSHWESKNKCEAPRCHIESLISQHNCSLKSPLTDVLGILSKQHSRAGASMRGSCLSADNEATMQNQSSLKLQQGPVLLYLSLYHLQSKYSLLNTCIHFSRAYHFQPPP